MRISIYKNRFGTEPIGETTVLDYLHDIKDGTYQDYVLAVRNGKAKKEDANGVTVSALFDANRRADNVKEHSGFIGIDLDDADNEDLLAKRSELEKDPYCYACHTSIRGFGLVWYVKISAEKHKDAFYAIEKYLANTYNVVVDPTGKDVSRFRFVSYDPDLYLNERSKKWTKYIPKKEKPTASPTVNAYHDDDIKHIIDQIQQKGINIAEDYDAWLKIGFALASEFGDGGRAYYHVISSQSAKYDHKKVDRQYDISVRRSADGIGIATFFWYCERAGIETRTPQTEEIKTVIKQRLKGGNKIDDVDQSVKEYFKEMDGIEADRIDPILKALKEVPISKLKSEKVDDKALELELFIKQFSLKFNAITRNVEKDGEPLDDRMINSIYRRGRHEVENSLSKKVMTDIMHSDLVPEYNPFLDFFRENAKLNSDGHIKEVLDCFNVELESIEMDGETIDFKEEFIKRWLLSIIASMHGTYSLLVLVLCGGQSSGKSIFFRELLPESLSNYQGQSKLDGGKDDEILMCKKILLLDDEFSGKSKREAAKFKEISSRDMFNVRRPYGTVAEDLKRIAVLCGTTNEGDDILNDMTGNRRLIPVNLVDFDIERFKAVDKDALFMELYREWKRIGDGWMLTQREIKALASLTEQNVDVTREEEMFTSDFKILSDTDRVPENLTRTDLVKRLELRYGLKVNERTFSKVLKKYKVKSKVKKINGFSVRVWPLEDIYRNQMP